MQSSCTVNFSTDPCVSRKIQLFSNYSREVVVISYNTLSDALSVYISSDLFSPQFINKKAPCVYIYTQLDTGCNDLWIRDILMS